MRVSIFPIQENEFRRTWGTHRHCATLCQCMFFENEHLPGVQDGIDIDLVLEEGADDAL